MDFGTLQGVGIILLMVAFVGLVVWAYSPAQRRRFDESARLALTDDDSPARTDAEKGARRNE